MIQITGTVIPALTLKWIHVSRCQHNIKVSLTTVVFYRAHIVPNMGKLSYKVDKGASAPKDLKITVLDLAVVPNADS